MEEGDNSIHTHRGETYKECYIKALQVYMDAGIEGIDLDAQKEKTEEKCLEILEECCEEAYVCHKISHYDVDVVTFTKSKEVIMDKKIDQALLVTLQEVLKWANKNGGDEDEINEVKDIILKVEKGDNSEAIKFIDSKGY